MAGVLLVAALVGGSCEEGEAAPDLHGTTVDIVAVWQDAEAEAFREVLDAFEAETGATVRYTSTEGVDTAVVLDDLVAADRAPDVAVLPQPGLLATYARRGVILPIDDLVGDAVRTWYPRAWQRLGSVDGELYGVWFKAADKSLVWYSISAFERAGVIPPSDLDGLAEVAAAVTASGTPAFSIATDPAAAWTLTDLFENLYLRLAGQSRYDLLSTHQLEWTDPSVEEALRAFVDLLVPAQRVDLGPEAGFVDSVEAVFSPTPRAAMVLEGDFVPGVVAGRSAAELGVDVDVFAFPEQRRRDRYVVGAGDAAVLMRDTRGGRELLRFLATPEAAEIWARRGGFMSPNEGVDIAAYPDPTTRQIARSLLDAGGGGFRFDLSDLQPAAFGGTTGEGMYGVLHDLLTDPSDIAGAAQRLEAAATSAWSEAARASAPRGPGG